MSNSIKSFFKIVGLEITKVFRNKAVLFSLISFTFVLLILMSFVNSDINSGGTNVSIGINKNGANISGTAIEKVLQISENQQNFENISTLNEGIKKVNNCDLDLFINVNTDTTPLTISVYYDKTNYIARTVVNTIQGKTNILIQEATNEYLNVIGVTVDEKYFDVVNYEPINKHNVNLRSSLFVAVTLMCISVVIIYGLAYSMARDNETQTIKNICYMPMGVSRYLLSKMVPYIILGVFELIISLVMGSLLYKISYQINLFILAAFCLIFIIALICLGLLISMFKSQTAAVVVGSLFILFPLLSTFSTVVRDVPSIVQYVVYLIPGVPFQKAMSAMVFNGVVLWKEIVLLLLQALAFCLTTHLLLKRKIEK